MLIKNEFQVAAPIDKVWQFFGDIPQVAACLPGTELTDDLGGDSYEGRVAVRMGPVRLLILARYRSELDFEQTVRKNPIRENCRSITR